MRYETPHDFIHDVVREKIPLRDISMQAWLYGVMLAMSDLKQPELDMTVSFKGALYKLHHRVDDIELPADAKATMETKQ